MRIMWFSLLLYVLYCSSQDLLGDLIIFFMKTIFPIYRFQYGWGQSSRPIVHGPSGFSLPLRGRKATIYQIKAYHVWISKIYDGNVVRVA